MSLGYEVFEDKRDFVQEGLTGDVKRYSIENVAYPCFVVVNTDEQPVKLTSIQMLKQMTLMVKQYDEEQAKMAIHIYYSQNETMVSLGIIYPNQVKSFLKLFKDCAVDGYLTENKILTGDYRYVLAE